MKHHYFVSLALLLLVLCTILCSAAASSVDDVIPVDETESAQEVNATPGPPTDPVPTVTPAPTDDSSKAKEFAITINNGSKTEKKTEVITLSSKSEKIKFTWPGVSGAKKYKVEIILTSDKDHPVVSKSQTKRNLSIAASDLEAGRKYRITVKAMKGSKVLKTAKLTFKFTVAAKRPSFRKRQSKKTTETADPSRQGVTSGSALTNRHVYGSKDDTLYGAVNVTSSPEAVNNLLFDDTALGILLDDGEGTFFADADQDGQILSLRSETYGDIWSMTLADLKTLKTSGIETLSLTASNFSTSIRTDLTLSGRLFALLKSQGTPDSDLILTVDENGLSLSTEIAVYRINEDLELEYYE